MDFNWYDGSGEFGNFGKDTTIGIQTRREGYEILDAKLNMEEYRKNYPTKDVNISLEEVKHGNFIVIENIEYEVIDVTEYFTKNSNHGYIKYELVSSNNMTKWLKLKNKEIQLFEYIYGQEELEDGRVLFEGKSYMLISEEFFKKESFRKYDDIPGIFDKTVNIANFSDGTSKIMIIEQTNEIHEISIGETIDKSRLNCIRRELIDKNE